MGKLYLFYIPTESSQDMLCPGRNSNRVPPENVRLLSQHVGSSSVACICSSDSRMQNVQGRIFSRERVRSLSTTLHSL